MLDGVVETDGDPGRRLDRVQSGPSRPQAHPHQGDGQIGTMLIPNSVGIIKDCPHPEAARKLVDLSLIHI